MIYERETDRRDLEGSGHVRSEVIWQELEQDE
jgi:hypothetical protein